MNIGYLIYPIIDRTMLWVRHIFVPEYSTKTKQKISAPKRGFKPVDEAKPDSPTEAEDCIHRGLQNPCVLAVLSFIFCGH